MHLKSWFSVQWLFDVDGLNLSSSVWLSFWTENPFVPSHDDVACTNLRNPFDESSSMIHHDTNVWTFL